MEWFLVALCVHLWVLGGLFIAKWYTEDTSVPKDIVLRETIMVVIFWPVLVPVALIWCLFR